MRFTSHLQSSKLTKHFTAQEVRDSRALPEVSEQDSMPDAPPLPDTGGTHRKRGRPRKNPYRNTEALYATAEQEASGPPTQSTESTVANLPDMLKDAISFDSDTNSSGSTLPHVKKSKKSTSKSDSGLTSKGVSKVSSGPSNSELAPYLDHLRSPQRPRSLTNLPYGLVHLKSLENHL